MFSLFSVQKSKIYCQLKRFWVKLGFLYLFCETVASLVIEKGLHSEREEKNMRQTPPVSNIEVS
jgi:hypothetical protein